MANKQINFISQDFFKKLKRRKKKVVVYLRLSKFFAVLGVVFIVFSFAPSVWYGLKADVADFSRAIKETILRAGKDKKAEVPSRNIIWQPKYDAKLPLENRLKITAVGIDAPIQEAMAENYEQALKKGIWRAPDFGTPFNRQKPTILAAHRFGYLAWSSFFRKKSSFYNLPKLKVGDTVEIIWRQRKYIYEVYGEGRGEEIADYEANLILYSCESLNSSIRIFKYARLLEM